MTALHPGTLLPDCHDASVRYGRRARLLYFGIAFD